MQLLIFVSILVYLFIKHFYVDFINQSDKEVKHKGIYLDKVGMKHSIKHGAFTAVLYVVNFVHPSISIFHFLIAGVLDFIIHYHIDYCKMKYGCRDITNKLFWIHLGLDQLLHSLTYVGIAYYISKSVL